MKSAEMKSGSDRIPTRFHNLLCAGFGKRFHLSLSGNTEHVKDTKLIKKIKLRKWLKSLPDHLLHYVEERISPKQVSFIIAGAQKGGTSALHSFLKQHPSISMAKVKETDFFSHNFTKCYKYYHRCFKPFTGKNLLGEASPSYMLKHGTAAPRMKEYNPNLKIIFILKNPVERVYSQYKMHKFKYNLRLTFEECLEIAKKNEGKNVILDPRSGLSTKTIESYFEFSHYSRQIRSFQNHFPMDRMLFLRSEELLENHAETMKRIFTFLGVPYLDVPHKIVHSNQDVGMSAAARSILNEEFKEEIEQLEHLLGWDLSGWKK